jgi:hypothetical protein
VHHRSLTGTIANSLPLLRASERLSKEGAMLTGTNLGKFEHVNAVLLDANELYPAGLLFSTASRPSRKAASMKPSWTPQASCARWTVF